MDFKERFIKEGNILFVLITLVSFSLLLLRLTLPDYWFFSITFPDDAYYYFKTARNIVLLGKSSFDGVNLSNGYHPLWMIILLPFFFAIWNQALVIKIIYVLCLVIFFLTMLFLWRLQKREWGFIPAFIGSIFILKEYSYFTNGLETPLFLLCLMIVFCFIVTRRLFTQAISRGNANRLSILCSLTFLSRLDSALILIFFLTLILIMQIRLQGLRNAVSYFMPALILGLCLTIPYIIVNKIVFGSSFPISGRLKTAFPHLGIMFTSDAYAFFMKYLKRTTIFIIFYFIVMGGFAQLLKRLKGYKYLSDDYFLGMASLLCGSSMYFLYLFLFSRWTVSEWYPASIDIIKPVLFPWILGLILRYYSIKHLKAVVCILSILYACFFITREYNRKKGMPKDRDHFAMYNAALWIRDNVLGNDVLASKDTGKMGYFSMHRMVNLDGLINNEELQDYIYADKIADYLNKNNVSYVIYVYNSDKEILDKTYNEKPLEFFATLRGYYHTNSIQVRNDKEVYRSEVFTIPDDATRYVLVIWKR